jgi:hypothetical protein
MAVDALLKLRDDLGKVLIQKADQLKGQLSRLGARATTGSAAVRMTWLSV